MADPVMKSVFSTMVSRIGYDKDTQELVVELPTGRVSAYGGVTADQADEISRSWSVGEAVSQLKKTAPHRYVK